MGVPPDALLVQLVRSSLGQNAETPWSFEAERQLLLFRRHIARGGVGGVEECRVIEEAVRRVPGVQDLVKKMIVRPQ